MNVNALKNELNSGEAFISSDSSTRFYLTGFSSSAGFIIVTNKNAYFLIDFRYFEMAQKSVKDFKVILCENFAVQSAQIFKNEMVNKLYVEPTKLSVFDFEKYKKTFSNITVSNSSIIEEKILKMRSVKCETEIENIKAAQELTDKTFSYILDKIKAGKTEREIMLEMEFYMRNLGSEGVSFDFIVVSGKNSSLPHGVPTDKKIEEGDFVTMDFGAVKNGYHADMTRTVAVGFATDEMKQVYNTVLTAQTTAIENISAGKTCSEIDGIARNIIYKAGYKGCFGHALGHSVGVDIHESPNFAPKSNSILMPNNVITVEPGVYLPNKFGVRIEDIIVVNENGCENITKSPKDLIVL